MTINCFGHHFGPKCWYSCLQLLSKSIRSQSLDFSQNCKTCCSSPAFFGLELVLTESQVHHSLHSFFWRSYHKHWCIQKAIIQINARLSQWAIPLLSIYDRLTNHNHNSICAVLCGGREFTCISSISDMKCYLMKISITRTHTGAGSTASKRNMGWERRGTAPVNWKILNSFCLIGVFIHWFINACRH